MVLVLSHNLGSSFEFLPEGPVNIFNAFVQFVPVELGKEVLAEVLRGRPASLVPQEQTWQIILQVLRRRNRQTPHQHLSSLLPLPRILAFQVLSPLCPLWRAEGEQRRLVR